MKSSQSVKVEVTSRVTIVAAPEAVFPYLKDLKRHYLWNPQIQSISPLIELTQGQTYRASRLLLGQELKVNNVVTNLVENKELALKNTTGLLSYEVSYILAGKGSKTLVICATTVHAQSTAFAFAKPVLKLLARRELQSDLQALKIAVEQSLK